VVKGDDERRRRAQRRPKGRTVEDVDAVPLCARGQQGGVPSGVPQSGGGPARAAEPVTTYVDVGLAVESRRQLVDVARRARARLREWGNVDSDAERSHPGSVANGL